jgi:hypothetical protein
MRHPPAVGVDDRLAVAVWCQIHDIVVVPHALIISGMSDLDLKISRQMLHVPFGPWQRGTANTQRGV